MCVQFMILEINRVVVLLECLVELHICPAIIPLFEVEMFNSKNLSCSTNSILYFVMYKSSFLNC